MGGLPSVVFAVLDCCCRDDEVMTTDGPRSLWRGEARHGLCRRAIAGFLNLLQVSFQRSCGTSLLPAHSGRVHLDTNVKAGIALSRKVQLHVPQPDDAERELGRGHLAVVASFP